MLPPVRFNTPNQIAVGDINSDNRPDLVFSRYLDEPEAKLGLIFQQPNGLLSSSQNLSDPLFIRPTAISISDINFDGLNDILVINTGYPRSGISAFTQNQNNTFDSPIYYPIPIINNVSGHSITNVDTDQDGKPDVFAFASWDGYILFLKPILGYELYMPLIIR